MPSRVTVVGLTGSSPAAAATVAPAAREAIDRADLLVGGRRLLAAADAGGWAPQARRRDLTGDLAGALRDIADAPGEVCILASGDPGFFGVVRPLAEALGRSRGVLEVHPAPSSVSLAFARLGLHWDDAAVVSAHGRPPGEAADAACSAPKVAVLTSPD
ncbi:MAG TPA: precorrin-6y C5,15-methyltransferase (decarboxylating) subunit CbiE, partial [Acidimicrobiales bacterium]|nr:precorrin-6y C5,15-methyltransferase (decarboxylating) subunit CbiE [Acidimicrobiales bacterium]